MINSEIITDSQLVSMFHSSVDYNRHKVYVTKNGCLCHKCVEADYQRFVAELVMGTDPTIQGLGVNWESHDITCDECEEPIRPYYS
jgi:hypothetical protein